MPKLLILFAITLIVAVAARGENAGDAAYDPPIASKAMQEAYGEPISQNVLGRYLLLPAKRTTFTAFAGQNEALKSRKSLDDRVLDLAEGLDVSMDAAELFGPGLPEDGAYVFRATVTSMDAQALRLRVDLSGLKPGEEVYVVDPVLPRAFGPYTAEDHVEGGRWLPTTEGAWAMLVVRSPSPALPELELVAVSHFYRAFAEFLKQLPCNVNIACEDSPALQDVASGVGMLVVPRVGGGQGMCTCTLINNADTPEREPYLLTSNHCVPLGADADQVDVVWDYRATECGSDDPPSLSSLPRSEGLQLLTTNSDLDITLMELDSVPNGAFGRYYVGWTDRALTKGEAITGIHHPRATHMRISYGDITDTSVSGVLGQYRGQIRVLWSEGVTEKGSSGTGLLLDAEGYRLIGTLSNGPTHICGGSANYDNFSSFRLFFPQAEGFLTGTNKPEPQDPADGGCPAETAFKDNPELLEQLRAFRDEGLMETPLGRRLVKAYYDMAPGMAERVAASPDAASLFRMLARPFAALGR